MLLLRFSPSTIAAPKTADPLSSAIVRFLYGHEKLCGDQFSDPNWLPALDMCELDCDLLTEVCQTTAKRVVMRTQRCLECAF
ncbi:hypothetical protein M3Y98_00309600 [Aphelenchoides besseyi]|nr:hypothetical protein M3Y98_00309600 [Aphelenchoides besseyi]KAI6201307.1 hypothetical protein M3Y96_00827800 [Aphelenchoides besseyi]